MYLRRTIKEHPLLLLGLVQNAYLQLARRGVPSEERGPRGNDEVPGEVLHYWHELGRACGAPIGG